MTQWKGKSQSPLIGFKIYVFLLRSLGVGFCYVLLRFVAIYFFFAVSQSRQANYLFFRKRLGYPRFKAYLHCFKRNYIYGQTLIDRVAIAIGKKKTYTFEFDGKQHIQNVLDAKQGGVFFTGHIGNFNVARYFFKELSSETKVNMVVTDREHADIKAYFEAISETPSINFIILKSDYSHAIPMAQAIKDKEVLIFATDRYLNDVQTLTESFFKKPVQFPKGPFKLAMRYNLPVLYVYCMREPKRHYHLFARPSSVENKNMNTLVKEYAQSLEQMTRRYPLQWFNFYDYWNDKSELAAEAEID